MLHFTVLIGDEQFDLPDDVEMPGGFLILHKLLITNDGIAKFRPDLRPQPITVVLTQAAGNDDALLKLFNVKAGFKLKITQSIPAAGTGVTMKDIRDINLMDLVPQSLEFADHEWRLTLCTLTPPEFPGSADLPKRISRAAKAAKN